MKGRRFASVLLVLSLLLMLVPMQAFAEENAAPEGIVTAAEDTSSDDRQQDDALEEDLSAAAVSAVSVPGSDQTAEEAGDAEPEAEEIVRALSGETKKESAAAVEDAEAGEAEEVDEAGDGEVLSLSAEEEDVQKEAALAGESDTITQLTLSESSGAVSWDSAAQETDASGVTTVVFSASIPGGATADELNLNVLDTPNLSELDLQVSEGDVVKYVVNVTDATKSYLFKSGSGALVLADPAWNVSETVSADDVAATQLSKDGSAYSSADTWMESAGEGNGFDSVLADQWTSDQAAQTLAYYQKIQNADADGLLLPVIQFKLTRAVSTETTTENAEPEAELSGTVPLSVKKVLTGQTLKAEQFSFELKDADGNVLQTQKNALDGTVAFESLAFTQADLGEHKYTINEVMPEGVTANADGKIVKDDIEYDTHTESVTITISLNEEGQLKATIHQSTTELTFTNKYTGSDATTTSRTSPATGDGTPMMLYFCGLAGACFALAMVRRHLRGVIRH